MSWYLVVVAWVRKNWKLYVWIPILIGSIWLLQVFRRRVVVVDPTVKADQRAATEAELRDETVEEAKADLDKALEALHADHVEETAAIADEMKDRVKELEGDPEALVQAMKRVGRGEPL